MCTHVFKERCTYTRNVAYEHVLCLEREKRETRGGGWREQRERERERAEQEMKLKDNFVLNWDISRMLAP